jgi:hypothetical protein
MNDEAVYRTAPATPGLLKSLLSILFKKKIACAEIFDFFAP